MESIIISNYENLLIQNNCIIINSENLLLTMQKGDSI